jgi:hypothetical protein
MAILACGAAKVRALQQPVRQRAVPIVHAGTVNNCRGPQITAAATAGHLPEAGQYRRQESAPPPGLEAD